LKIDEAKYGDHPAVSSDLDHYALLSDSTGRQEKAVVMLRRSLLPLSFWGLISPSSLTDRYNMYFIRSITVTKRDPQLVKSGRSPEYSEYLRV
jgi:hypothetical protein